MADYTSLPHKYRAQNSLDVQCAMCNVHYGRSTFVQIHKHTINITRSGIPERPPLQQSYNSNDIAGTAHAVYLEQGERLYINGRMEVPTICPTRVRVLE